jgi:hypothetical protein
MLEECYNPKTKTLLIPHYFNDELKDLCPDTEIIIFLEDYDKTQYSRFNNQIDKLPQNLIRLTFGWNFNGSINHLPPNLIHLTFGGNFNQPVDNLPQKLTHLTFGRNFNKPVDNLPPNLTHLTFGEMFNKSVDNLPPNLTHLVLGWRFCQKLDNLPISLIEIKIIKPRASILKLQIKVPFGCKVVDTANKEVII